LQDAVAAIFTRPVNFGLRTIELEPAVSGTKDNLVFAEFYGCLMLAVEAVGCGVAAKQGSERDPELGP
jgi:hypothetical protein